MSEKIDRLLREIINTADIDAAGELIKECKRTEEWEEVLNATTASIALLMTKLEAMKQLNKAVKKHISEREDVQDGLFIVRLYDAYDHMWMDITKPLSCDEAQVVWDVKTRKGARNTCYSDGTYYHIFPADTRMVFRSGA